MINLKIKAISLADVRHTENDKNVCTGGLNWVLEVNT